MNNKNNWNKMIQKACAIMLLLTMFVQFLSVLLLVTDLEIFEIDEIHETIGFIFYGLTIIHIVIYRKYLFKLFSIKVQQT